MVEQPVHWKRNLLFFVGVYLGLLIAYVAISWAVEIATGYSPPSFTGLIVFYLAAYWSGRQYAIRSGWRWERSDRFALAATYSTVAVVASLILVAPVVFLDPQLQALPLYFWSIVVLVTPIYGLVQYGVARWAFARMDEHEHRAGVTK